MRGMRSLEWWVGSFLFLALAAFLMLAIKVSGLTQLFAPAQYHVFAEFDEIGQLKIRAPVKISGVRVGEVSKIELNNKNYKAIVTLRISQFMNRIPDDSSIQILTSGLLGDNYLEIKPMYSEQFMHAGSYFSDTQSAMVLEKLIGQLIFKLSDSGQASKDTNAPDHVTIGESNNAHKK